MKIIILLGIVEQLIQNNIFGTILDDIRPEPIVNNYIYIKGEELINEIDIYQEKDEIIRKLKEMLNE